MKGIILADKPEGWTSFDVVNYVRKKVALIEGKKPKYVKCGHTGTLDPAATGLLVLCVGKEYTKKVPSLIKQNKTYEAEITLGKTSTTDDREGEIKDISKDKPSEAEVKNVLSKFVGLIKQTPPIYSALKINGKRAYELAREGKDVKMEPREVNIISIDNIHYDYPKVSFRTEVGSGTYIRSLAVDIGEGLGVGAYLSSLRRTAIGDKNIDQAYTISELTDENIKISLDTTE